MDYLEELLWMQMALAAELEEEPRTELTEHSLPRSKRKAEQAVPSEQAEAAGEAEWTEDREVPAPDTEEVEALPQKRLLLQWTELQSAVGRIGLLSQTLSERQLAATQTEQGAYVSQLSASRFSGGLTADATQRMLASGIAGHRTGQTMSQISRYFERDARRYGG